MKISDLLFVPKCGICGERMETSGDGLCPVCRRALDHAQSSLYCADCGMEAKLCRCIPQLMLLSDCRSYRKVMFYDPGKNPNIVRRYLYALKRRHFLPQIKAAGRRLCEVAEELPQDALVTFAPRTHTAQRTYGYDQSKQIAKAFAKATGRRFLPLLRRRRFVYSGEQKKLGARARSANVKNAFSLVRKGKICGKTVILVDDVVTAGATMAACAALLYAAGACEVHCLSLAYTVKNKNKIQNDG